jgi:hypothetical protein
MLRLKVIIIIIIIIIIMETVLAIRVHVSLYCTQNMCCTKTLSNHIVDRHSVLTLLMALYKLQL